MLRIRMRSWRPMGMCPSGPSSMRFALNQSGNSSLVVYSENNLGKDLGKRFGCKMNIIHDHSCVVALCRSSNHKLFSVLLAFVAKFVIAV